MPMGDVRMKTEHFYKHPLCGHEYHYEIQGATPFDLHHAISMIEHEKECPPCAVATFKKEAP